MKSFSFNDLTEKKEIIDIYATIKIIYRHIGTKTVANQSFANKIVLTALSTLDRNLAFSELIGIKKCICHLLRGLEWKDDIFGLPIGATRKVTDLMDIDLLSGSLIMTLIFYKDLVHDIRQRPYCDILNGFERMCNISSYGRIKTEEPYIISFTPEQLEDKKNHSGMYFSVTD